MNHFDLLGEDLDLPPNAFVRGYRKTITFNGRPLLGFSQGPHRNYLYPVYSPQGYLVTTESPADHPHHNSVWVATDHVHALMPGHGGSREDASYCFYVNEVFQGRAPGRIVEESFSYAQEGSAPVCLVEQSLIWRGPVEWGSQEGRVILREARTTRIEIVEDFCLLDVSSTLYPEAWELVLGPTRHAYFGVRVAESMRVLAGGRVFDADGREGGKAISWKTAAWIDYSGPVGGGHTAGISVFPGGKAAGSAWFVTDWGTIAANPLMKEAIRIAPGEKATFTMGLAVHDGPWDGRQVSEAFTSFRSRGSGE